jgi:hypothetical protein
MDTPSATPRPFQAILIIRALFGTRIHINVRRVCLRDQFISANPEDLHQTLYFIQQTDFPSLPLQWPRSRYFRSCLRSLLLSVPATDAAPSSRSDSLRILA